MHQRATAHVALGPLAPWHQFRQGTLRYQVSMKVKFFSLYAPCRYMEVAICPLLLHRGGNMPPVATDAVARGALLGQAQYHVNTCGIKFCSCYPPCATNFLQCKPHEKKRPLFCPLTLKPVFCNLKGPGPLK